MEKQWMTGVGHVGVPVSSLEKSIEFYEKLGFHPAFRGNVGGSLVAMMEQNGLIFELFQQPTEMDAVMPRDTGCIDHLAISVNDIDKAYADITALGMKVIDGICQIPCWENGTKYFMIEGPDKERIEFAQVL